MLKLLEVLGRRIDAASPATLWSPVYGLARTLLALGTAGTLAFTSTEVLFHPVSGSPPAPYCFHAAKVSLFCVVPHLWSLQAARWVAIALLLVTATGWRPRFTALPHWWVAFSLQNSGSIVDGGDQVAAVLTLLLLPLALTDPRKSHWSVLPDEAAVPAGLRMAAFVGRGMILVQVAGLYFHSAVAKFGVPEWANGTALYYWMTDPTYAPPSLLAAAARGIVSSSTGVLALTWGTLILELALALALAFPLPVRRTLLPLGIAFHAGIALTMGLVSFFFSMSAVLLLYLAPPDAWQAMASRVRRRAAAAAPPGEPHPSGLQTVR
jgi:sporulation delaying protein B